MSNSTKLKRLMSANHVNAPEEFKKKELPPIMCGVSGKPIIIDYSCFKKTDYDKTQLFKLANKKKPKEIYFSSADDDTYKNNIKYRVIVYCENTKKDQNFKTTHSDMISSDELPHYLFNLNEQGYKFKKIFYNGKNIKV